MLTNHARALKGWLYGRPRWQRVSVVLVVALGAVTAGALVGDGDRRPPRPAGPVVEAGYVNTYGPMLPGERLSVGSVRLWNRSPQPATVESVSLRPRAPRGLHLLGFRIMDVGPTAPHSQRSFPPAGSHNLRDYEIRPYDESPPNHNAAVIIVGLSVDTGARGHIEGLDVVYRVGAKRYTLRLHNAITLCGFEFEWGDCDDRVGP